MKDLSNKHFNPSWRDDYFNPQALDIPLLLPDAGNTSNRENAIWIQKSIIDKEFIFEHLHQYPSLREKVAILKPSDMTQHYQMHNLQGEVIESQQSILATLFPPKAWMTDSGEERCMMLAAAILAKGHVLIAGLGLAIYPQFIFALKRPVKSITIIESNPQVIALIAESWLSQAHYPLDNLRITESTIEAYLQQTDQLFDTIYLDTWEDADPRFLANINSLIDLATSCCTTDGAIQCWGYAKILETFIEHAKMLTKQSFPFDDYYLDPVLERYAHWLKKTSQIDKPSTKMITEIARKYGLTTQKSLNDYDRNRCFTPFAHSRTDLYRNMALAQKASKE